MFRMGYDRLRTSDPFVAGADEVYISSGEAARIIGLVDAPTVNRLAAEGVIRGAEKTSGTKGLWRLPASEARRLAGAYREEETRRARILEAQRQAAAPGDASAPKAEQVLSRTLDGLAALADKIDRLNDLLINLNDLLDSARHAESHDRS